MRPADRLFELIEILRRAHGPLSAELIARELEVSKRTVYRDIATLVAQRVPIEGEAGVGYVLAAGFHMPPLMLTFAEIEAVILGAQWVHTRGEHELAHAASSLIAKIRAVVPSRLQPLFIEPVTSVAPVLGPSEVLSAADFRTAIRHRNKVWLRYVDDKGQSSERVVWPLMIGYRDTGRIVAAWCELRQSFRYFRTEKIVTARVLDETIPRRMDYLKADWRKAMDAERRRFSAQESDTSTPTNGAAHPETDIGGAEQL